MTNIFSLPSPILAAAAPLALLALSACENEPAAQPSEPMQPPVTAPATPSLPAPNEEIFSAAFAAACPSAEPVSTSLCRSMGMGESDFTCRYGLGNDEYLRHNARLTPGDGEWTLVDPETVCAQ